MAARWVFTADFFATGLAATAFVLASASGFSYFQSPLRSASSLEPANSAEGLTSDAVFESPEDVTAAPTVAATAAAVVPDDVEVDALAFEAADVDEVVPAELLVSDSEATGLHISQDKSAPPMIKIKRPTNAPGTKFQSRVVQSSNAAKIPTAAAISQHQVVQLLFRVEFSMSCPSPI